jgi:hypothetical protein
VGAWLLVGTLVLGGVQAPVVRHVSRLAGGALEVVTAIPGAWVSVDGDRRGRTPLRVAGLVPGSHRIEIKGDGLGFSRDVHVEDGVVVQVQASPSGVAVTQAKADPTATAASSPPAQATLPEMDWSPVKAMLAQPWAYGAAAATGVALVGAGVVWTATPERFPLVGQLPMNIQPWQYAVVRWGSVVVVGLGVLLTATLFVLPALPPLRRWLAPQPDKPSATTTPAPAAAPR